ncbi:MAG: hypothetical protein J0H65_03405 [Rhizobiales bacterium]|nr:hypothetical protein [Hyphomicrobiales bacterium]
MAEPHVITGLLAKRQELMDKALQLREQLAEVSNCIQSVDHVLQSFGYEGDLQGMTPRGNRVVYFHRNELRRFCIEELRKANHPVAAREIAEKVIKAEGKDPRDRKLGNDMVKRVGKALKLLREQGVATSQGRAGALSWHLGEAS